MTTTDTTTPATSSERAALITLLDKHVQRLSRMRMKHAKRAGIAVSRRGHVWKNHAARGMTSALLWKIDNEIKRRRRRAGASRRPRFGPAGPSRAAGDAPPVRVRV